MLTRSRPRWLVLALASVLATLRPTGAGAEVAPANTPTDWQVFFIGHSLMSDIPSMTRALMISDGTTRFEFRHQDIPGAPLRWQWGEKDRRSDFEPQFGGRYHVHLRQGGYNALILTDSVPRGGEELEAETVDYLGRFVAFARQHNPNIRLYYYATWSHLTSGTAENDEHDHTPRRHLRWRERLDADQGMWEAIVQKVNTQHPGEPPVTLIPAGQVLASVHDAIVAGDVPGLSKIEDLFGDAIHINLYGKYLVALTHYAALRQRPTLGLPYRIQNVWGGDYWDTRHWDGQTYPAPAPETVRALQQIVDRVMGVKASE